MNNVLITGAGGFIGSHLVEALVENGYNVRAFVYYNSFNSYGWLDTISNETKRKIDFFSGDIRDPNGVREAMKGIDIVFHLAALIAIPFSYHSPDSYIDTNVKGTLNILQAARDNKVKRIVITSTSEVYGTAQFVPITELHPKQPQSPYSASKIGADAIAADAITSVKIFAEAITTDKIAANSITGGLIAASGVITNTAQINDGLITNAKIGNLAVTSAKIANLAVTTGKIANLSVDTLQIAGNAVTLPTGAFTIGNLFPFYQYDNISINYATAQSVTFTESAGTSTEIFWSFFGDVMSGDSDSGDLDYARIYVRLRRNGTVILDYGKLWYLDTGPNYKTGMVNGSYQHIGSSGIATYTLEIGRQGNNIQVSKRNLITMELKK